MTENSISSKHPKIISGIKYIYLVGFFALLSGLFHPIITESPMEDFVYGILILFLGLTGGILVYKGITSNKLVLTSIGLGITIISLVLIHQMTQHPLFEI